MVNVKVKAPKIAKRIEGRLVRTVPDQSMSIQEIVRRFVRGIPIDVAQRNPIYVDQNLLDLEKMSRMDSTDKAFEANAMRERNDAIFRRMEENERREADRKKQEEEQRKQSREDESRDIGALDNTMSDDTKHTRPGRRVSNSKSQDS